MATRILHCGKLIENYYKCIEEHVAGFGNRAPAEGDIVYLAVKVGKTSLCGARGTLGRVSEKKPWEDRINYPHIRELDQLEFCDPFDISILKSVGGKSWHLKYLQSSKTIKEAEAINILKVTFGDKRCASLVRLD